MMIPEKPGAEPSRGQTRTGTNRGLSFGPGHAAALNAKRQKTGLMQRLLTGQKRVKV